MSTRPTEARSLVEDWEPRTEDDERWIEDLHALLDGVDRPEQGFFGPGTVTWRVNRENALLLSGASAALLQLAHPLVGEGVADHSDFDEDPAGRLKRTFAIVDAIVFGDAASAVEAALDVRELHHDVVGGLDDATGPFAAGDGYRANDPELLLWVHATLIDQALEGYEAYVGSLSASERERYWQQSKRFGRLFGIRREDFPATIEDFYDDYERTLEEEIAVGDTARRLRDALLTRFRGADDFLRFLAASTMPEPARDAFGFRWRPGDQRRFDRMATAVDAALPLLPARIRFDDHYRANADRLGVDYRRTLSGPRRWLARRVELPVLDTGDPLATFIDIAESV